MSFVSMSSTNRKKKTIAIRRNNWQTFSRKLFKMKTVTFQRNRKGKLQPFTCVTRKPYYFSIYNKSISMRVNQRTKLIPESHKDWISERYFNSNKYSEFSERSQNVAEDLLHLVPQHNAYILINHKTITMLSSVSYSWWNDRFKSIVCVCIYI